LETVVSQEAPQQAPSENEPQKTWTWKPPSKETAEEASNGFSSNPLLSSHTPNQLEAQKRMELMQREVDEVIGIMEMKFDHNCMVGPDKRLAQLYNLGPDYNPMWKCARESQEAFDKNRRRKRIMKQIGALFGFLLLIALFIAVDYFLSNWMIIGETEQELKQRHLTSDQRHAAPVKESSTISTSTSTETATPPPPPPISSKEPELVEEVIAVSLPPVLTTEPPPIVMINPETETEATIAGNQNSDLSLWDMFGQADSNEQFPRGHDVLEPAKVELHIPIQEVKSWDTYQEELPAEENGELQDTNRFPNDAEESNPIAGQSGESSYDYRSSNIDRGSNNNNDFSNSNPGGLQINYRDLSKL